VSEHEKAKLRKAMRALRLANSIMAYCAGDSWENECTQPDRNKFNKLFEDLTGEAGEA
jgi:ribosomal protein L25 (general stress protein Ctc)